MLNSLSLGLERHKLALTLFALSLLFTATLTAPAHVLASGSYSGIVFRDYNANGAQDSREPGIGGVTVTLYDSAGTARGSATTFGVSCAASNSPAGLGCTGSGTPALGSYSISSTGTGPYRVEFTNPPSIFQPGANPSALNSSQTTVQFVNNGGAIVNLGLNDPSQYVNTTNPTLVTNSYIWGPYNNATGSSQTALYSWDYTLNSTPASNATNQGTSESTHGQIGSTWGLAYRRSTNTLYASAFLKRLAGFGPGMSGSDGSGTIYAITPNGGGADNGTPFVDIDVALGGNQTGNNLHNADFTCGSALSCDADAFANVGKASLGDMEMSGDESKMWVVNLFNKHLVEIQFTSPNPTVVDRGVITGPTCTNGTARPFALGWNDGLLYIGGVCDASTGSASNLTAWVITFDPATNTINNTPVLSFPLNYNRTCLNRDTYTTLTTDCNAGTSLPSLTAPRALWHPWTDTIGTIVVNNQTFEVGDRTGGYTQPIFSDIVFDNQDMILGFRDRTGDMLGYNDPGPNSDNPLSGNPNLRTLPGGDILRANPGAYAANGYTITGWTIETAGHSNPNGIFGPSGGDDNFQGPGDGEFYYQETGPKGADNTGGTNGHQETSLGGLVQVPGFSQVALTAYSPRYSSTIGQVQLTNSGANAGQTARTVQVVGNNNNGDSGISGPGQNLSKTNGLGDMEALLTTAPIEIGNRIWNDTTKNGRQDPGEAGIANVVVGLYNSAGVLIAQVNTDSNGNYLFSSASGTDVTGKNYGVTISPNTQYTVAVFDSNFNTGQPLAATPNRTIANFDGITTNNAFTDIRDSDLLRLQGSGVGSGGNAALNGVTITTSVISGVGYNNHSLDFGFSSTPTAAEMGALHAQLTDQNQASITWETLNEARVLGFNVQRSESRKGDFVNLNANLIPAQNPGGLTGSTYQYTDTTGVAGMKYWYRIDVQRVDGTGGASDAVALTIPAASCSLGTPVLTGPANASQVKKGKLTFAWNASACATTYKWQVRTGSPDGEIVANKKGLTTTSLTFKKLAAGKTYYWRVSACDANGACAAGEWWTVQVKRAKK